MWRAADLDPGDGTKTEQVEGLVLRRIERGDISIGSRLPSERVLAERLGVSRVTVVRALDQLRAEGVLETRRGSGTHVRPLDRLLDPVAPASTVSRGDRPLLDLRFATTAAPHD
ncbi:MAG: GntR family transcriptional regulator, partial [Nocardioidaceae bacterium]